jgi:hypothetical protein
VQSRRGHWKWKGTNKVFKQIPWARIHGEKIDTKWTKEGWESWVKRDKGRSWERAENIKIAIRIHDDVL